MKVMTGEATAAPLAEISISESPLECLRAQASHGHLDPAIQVQARLGECSALPWRRCRHYLR
jgi:hypothetical protein